MDTPTRDEFVATIRDALSHLHSPDKLRQSPLVSFVGLSGQFDAAARLRTILTDGIRSLKPVTDDGAGEQAWRLYDSLFGCYVQQLSQRVVSDQLGISARQLRREQRVALEALADVLWAQIDTASSPPSRLAWPVDQASSMGDPSLSSELEWLQESAPAGPTDIQAELAEAVGLVQPLASQHGVRVELSPITSGLQTAAHAVIVRQSILNLLSNAIEAARPNTTIRIAGGSGDWQSGIEVLSKLSGERTIHDEWRDDRLAACRGLAESAGGRLDVTGDAEDQVARLSFPGYQQLPVLLVDDNADALQLMNRFLSHTPYRAIATREPREALSLAVSEGAEIVVLDVMMPGQDGWDVLGQLREQAATSHIPVIVCTILPQESLALSLGASGFIRKPVTRERFLATLDAQAKKLAPVPR